MTLRPRRGERGATAVIVALLSVLLFSLAAIAVDLGNAWARKRAVQASVDVSTLSAGYLLPQTTANTTEIANRVAEFLNQNATTGQSAVTGAQLLDGIDANGEITFLDDNGNACADGCSRMSVLAPSARVDFGFARIMGFTHTDVQRTATIQVESSLPPKQKLVPFWLPSGCGLGPAQVDTRQGQQSTPTPTPTATGTSSGTASPSASASPTATPTVGFTPATSETGNHVLAGASPITMTQGTSTRVTSYSITNIPNNTDRASLRFWSPDGTFYIDYAAQAVSKGTGTLAVPPFSVGAEVSNTPGAWRVYALVQNNGNVRYSANHLTIDVVAASPSPSVITPTASASSSPTSIPVGCVGQDRGNFGQLDSPRQDGSTGQKRLTRNLAGGLDHQLAPFVFAPTQEVTKDCGSTNDFIAGAQPDNVSSSDPPRNCIIGDTGNDGPALYDGLITGADNGEPGRLDVSKGATTCPNGSQNRSDVSIGGKTINNDVLSCFLVGGHTLSDISQESGVTADMLDPRVIDSPRFVWLPVVVASDRAQKRFQPIIDFVPAFITNETQVSAAVDDGGGNRNGLMFNGAGNSLDVLQVFTFNKDALPVDERSPSVKYDETLRMSVVRLVR